MSVESWVERGREASPWGLLLILASGFLAGTDAGAQAGDDVREVPLRGPVHFLSGGGGANVSLSAGADGVLIVDSKNPTAAAQILALAGRLSTGGVRYLINGHEHPDHTDGNATISAAGATIIAHQSARDILSAGQRGGPPAPAAALPVITVGNETALTLHFNGEDITIRHVAPAHAASNVVVHYQDSNILHLGDLFSPTRYPVIAEGRFEAFITAMEIAIGLANADTLVVPGSGPMANREDMIAYRDMLLTVRDRANAAIDAGLSPEVFIASRPTLAFDTRYGDSSHRLFLPVVFAQLAEARR